jgi:hypothetical protein
LLSHCHNRVLWEEGISSEKTLRRRPWLQQAAHAELSYGPRAAQQHAAAAGGVITDKRELLFPMQSHHHPAPPTKRAESPTLPADSPRRPHPRNVHTVEVEKAGFLKQSAKNLEVVINKTQSGLFTRDRQCC